MVVDYWMVLLRLLLMHQYHEAPKDLAMDQYFLSEMLWTLLMMFKMKKKGEKGNKNSSNHFQWIVGQMGCFRIVLALRNTLVLEHHDRYAVEHWIRPEYSIVEQTNSIVEHRSRVLILQDCLKLDHDYALVLVMLRGSEHIPLFAEVNQDYSSNVKFPDYAKRKFRNVGREIEECWRTLPPLNHAFVDC